MQILMISGEHYGQGPDLARAVSRKLGWPVVNREELVEQARQRGIKMGRLEVAMIKPARAAEKLARQKELYLAFATASLCERACEGNFIYHGRAGHLLLPGVSHRLRVGITSPREKRLRRAARSLRMPTDRVERSLDLLDEDVGRWNRFVHRADGRDPSYFDMMLNLDTMSVSNAASLLCSTVDLPDFVPTPASSALIADHLLASRAKLRLLLDERTSRLQLLVHADDGELRVAYPPSEEGIEGRIQEVLGDLEGCRELVCIMADSTILWVQERFDTTESEFEDITDLAQRWGAVIDMMRLVPDGTAHPRPPDADSSVSLSCDYDGGVEDDDPWDEVEDGGMAEAAERLEALGCGGGQATILGGDEQVMERIRGRGQYALVVVGSVFLTKGEASRKRLTRELAMAIRDRLKTPVVTADELRPQWLFGRAQAVQLVLFAAAVILLYVGLFHFQEPILDFLGGPMHERTPWAGSIAVGLAVPAVAYLYGTVSGLVLKLMNID